MLCSQRNKPALNNLHNWPHEIFAGRKEKNSKQCERHENKSKIFIHRFRRLAQIAIPRRLKSV